MWALTCVIPPVLQDDEYVVYSPDQVKLKYVVKFNIDGDKLKEFSPTINTSAEPCPPPSDQGVCRTSFFFLKHEDVPMFVLIIFFFKFGFHD